MSSFRQYGGLNRAPTNNIVRNHYSNSDNPTISNFLGLYNSKIVSESHLDLSGNSILNVHGIYFDNSFTIIDGSLNGDVTINGNLEVTKNTQLDGSLNVFGDAQFDGRVNRIYINNGKYDIPNNNTILNSDIIQSSNPLLFTGVYNTIIGQEVMLNATSASFNSCFGFENGRSIKTGSSNTLIGFRAGEGIIDGSFNTALGLECYAGVGADYSWSTAIGAGAQPTGNHQIMLGTLEETVVCPGDVSLNSTLSVGGDATFDASMVVYGDVSLNSTLEVGGNAQFDGRVNGIYINNGKYDVPNNNNTILNSDIIQTSSPSSFTGEFNTIIGQQVMLNATNASFNSCFGIESGMFIETGSSNTLIGFSAGEGIRNGSYNTALGINCYSGVDFSYSTAIGYGAQPTSSNQIMLGTPQETVVCPGDLQVAGTVTTTSDYRIKTDIKPLDPNFAIDHLNPVSYTNKLSGKKDTGFIAHEIQEIFPHLVTGEKDGEQTQTLNYIGLIAILTREIQELKKRIEILETK
jgi:hypothetical protein